MAESEIKTCSFCGKTSEEVKKIIVSAAACVCNECTEAHINMLAKGGHLDEDFVPSWSLCSVVVDYLGEVIDLKNNFRDIDLEWLQDSMGDLKGYEVREVFLEEKLQEMESDIAEDEIPQSIHAKIPAFKQMILEKATIPYQIETFLRDNVRP